MPELTTAQRHEREKKRHEAWVQAQADQLARDQAQATAGMKHPGVDMVRVWSVAGFELAAVFEEWNRRADDECRRLGWAYPTVCTAEALTICNGLGPPWPCGVLESPKAFGDRVAKAILVLIKEA